MVDSGFLIGIGSGLLVQFITICTIFSLIIFSLGYLYVPISWSVMGLSSVVYIYLLSNYGLNTSIGLVLPYAIILPFFSFMTWLLGSDTAILLLADGIKLLIFLAIALLVNQIF